MVSWDEIDAESGGYRNGFVAVFRKYEGEVTDERDARGRAVKVTVASFCRHFGFDDRAFGRWVREGVATTPSPKRQEQQVLGQARSVVRNRPDAVVEALMSAPERTRNQIMDQVKLREAGIDTSEANRKAAVARTHKALEPIRRAISTIDVELCAQALDEAKHHLEEAITNGSLTDAGMNRISTAFDAFSFVMAEARFAVS